MCPSGTNYPKLNFTQTGVGGFTEGLFNTCFSLTPKTRFSGLSAVVLVAAQNETAGEKSSQVLRSDFVATFLFLSGGEAKKGGQ